MIVLLLLVCILAGVIGASMASSRGLNAILMGVVCFLMPIGVFVLAFLPAKTDQANEIDATSLSEFSKSERWKALKLVDADIAGAAEEAAALGIGYENKLAKQYLILNDKSYLVALVDRLTEERIEDENQISDGLINIEGKFFNENGEYVCSNCRAPNILGNTICNSCSVSLNA